MSRKLPGSHRQSKEGYGHGRRHFGAHAYCDLVAMYPQRISTSPSYHLSKTVGERQSRQLWDES